ncbi:MAG: GTP-binding protein, partial [Alphaproteobacteria bacterium]|nr:GTP-binding protein [Alphaproteobacteria bacterium]
ALDPPEEAEPEALARILADPAHGLLRAKGFMRRPGGGMAAIQTVGNRWSVSEAPPNAPAGLICIGLEDRTDFAALRRAAGCT